MAFTPSIELQLIARKPAKRATHRVVSTMVAYPPLITLVDRCNQRLKKEDRI